MLAPDAVLDNAGVWGGPVSADSPLLSPATLAKLAPGEAAAVPLLVQSLLLQHGKRLKGGAVGGPWSSACAAVNAEGHQGTTVNRVNVSWAAAMCGRPHCVLPAETGCVCLPTPPCAVG